MEGAKNVEVFKGTAPLGAVAAFPDGRLAWPIADFCKAVNISRSQWYELCRVGRAPQAVMVGRRPMVTPEAVRHWLAQLEAPADVDAAIVQGPEVERLRAFLAGRTEVTMQQVLTDALGFPRERWSRALQTRIGALLHSIGWHKKDRGGGSRPRCVYRPATTLSRAA